MATELAVRYTTEATVDGGRNGRARTPDGRLDVALDAPPELGGTGGPGTNPEQLFAAGYAACFHSAVLSVARGRNVDVAGCRLRAEVSLGTRDDGRFALAVVLDLDAPGLTAEEAAALMTRAHRRCPYSSATRGNIDVALRANGAAVDAAAD